MAAQIVEQGPHVRARMQENEQEHVGIEGRDDGKAVLELQYGGGKGASGSGGAQRIGRGGNGWGQGGDLLGVEGRGGAGVDDQPVAPQHDGGVHPFALSDGPNEVVNGGHRRFVVVSRSITVQQVKSSEQSLEVPQVRRLLYAVLSTLNCARLGVVRARRALGVLLAAGAVFVAACDDPFAPRATTAVRTDTFSVFALSGTPVNVPTAFNVLFFTTVRVEPTYGFDFAFDIDQQERVLLIPVSKMGGVVTAGRRVGFQRPAVAFDEVMRAPAGGYHLDSTFVLGPREPVIVELISEACPFGVVSQFIYSKLEVLAINPADRRLTFRITYDPNCGFRSFLPGIPAN